MGNKTVSRSSKEGKMIGVCLQPCGDWRKHSANLRYLIGTVRLTTTWTEKSGEESRQREADAASSEQAVPTHTRVRAHLSYARFCQWVSAG